ncbi:MAG: hypothetical protein ACTSR2_02650 [Candidatus Hodarchaeales archaeon]
MTKEIIKKKTPSGKINIHEIKKRFYESNCKICGRRLRKIKVKSSKSSRKAARPFGSEICHSCLRSSIQSLPQ